MSGRTAAGEKRLNLLAKPASRRRAWARAALILVAAVAAYHNSFSGPFIFDDEQSVVENPTIRRLWPIAEPLCPPGGGETVSGRPLINLSLAINYALGGLDVAGYHLLNLAVHLAAALVLYGLVRRTCLLAGMPSSCAGAAVPLATIVAALWAVHPLNPNYAGAHENLAWLLATCPEARIRSGSQAVQHAERAIALTRRAGFAFLATLAAAHAEAGNFTEAVRRQEKAVASAPEEQKDALRQRLELYKAGKPYRVPASSGAGN